MHHGRVCRGAIRETHEEIPLHLPEKLHVDRRITTAKRTQKVDRHKVTKLVTRRIPTTRIIHIIEIAHYCWNLETPSGDETSRIQCATEVKL